MKIPIVSIIIPSRNEEKFIGQCLDSLLKQDYPRDKLEIIVVDGASTDKTREIVIAYARKFPAIRLLENPRRTTPISMNLGIKNALGDFITKSDAHTLYPANYISKCVAYLQSNEVDAVGGVARTLPAKENPEAQAIALALSSFLGAGNSDFRIMKQSDKPHLSDTAFGILYKKNVFEKIGLFNEKLTRSQDMDFSLRLTKAGGKILIAPDIELSYFPKSTFKEFWEHNLSDGEWAILPLKYGGSMLKPRHLLPLLFVLGLLVLGLLSLFWNTAWLVFIGALAIYAIILFYFSITIALTRNKPQLFPFLVFAFLTRHFGYGLGSLWGLVSLVRR